MSPLKTSTLIIALLLVGCGEASSPTTSANKEASVNFSKPQQEIILEAINRARAEQRDCRDGRGLVGPSKPLTWNSELYSASLEHSTDLAQSNTFSHLGSGESSDVTGSNNGNSSLFYERIEANGYVGYRIVGGNIAGGQQTVEEVMEAWLDSPDHCTNIMNPKYSEVGVAIVTETESDYGVYWTQSFGSKK